MQFTVTVGTPCASGGHVPLTFTAGAQSRQIVVTRDDFTIDFSNIEAVMENALVLIRSRVKEDGATTPAQIKASIESRPFFL